MKIIENPIIALTLGIISIVFIVGAMSAHKKDDGLSLELSSKLIKPVQIIKSVDNSEPSFKAPAFSLTESVSIKISMAASLLMGLICLAVCFVAAKRKAFGLVHSVSFLLSAGAFVLLYFEFGFLINA